MTDWLISIFAFAVGLLFWAITYIGAPIESKRKGKHVSGLPGAAFVLFFARGADFADKVACVHLPA